MDENKLTHDLSRDLYGALALREKGIQLVKWEATKGGAMMAFGGAACVLPLIVTSYYVGFELPALAVASIMSIGLARACHGGWRVHRRRLGELEIINVITPLVTTWREGREINSRDRDHLHQFKELLFAQVVRYREEADEWRKKGRVDKGAAYTALLIELEDAKKLLDGGFVRREREIRPPATPAELIIEPAPLDRESGKTSGLEQFGKREKESQQ